MIAIHIWYFFWYFFRYSAMPCDEFNEIFWHKIQERYTSLNCCLSLRIRKNLCLLIFPEQL